MTHEPAEPAPSEEPLGQSHAGPSTNPGYPPAGGYRAGIRHLRRRTADRVVGGVAGGLGDYLNVDPILIRVAFAGLMIFGGAGIALYVLGWLLIPDMAHQESIAQTMLRTLANRLGRIGMLVLVVAAVVIFSPWISSWNDRYAIPTEVFWALAIAIVGVILLLPREGGQGPFPTPITNDAGAGPRAAASAAGAAPATTEAPSGYNGEGWAQAAHLASAAHGAPAGWSSPPYARTWPAGRPRDPSPLGWYGIAAAFLIVGVLALIDTIASARVLPGQYFGGGLLALGLALVVGAWRGRARLLILVGLVVFPIAATAAFLTVPLEGGVAEASFQPQQLAEVQDAYHLVAGELWIDLTQLAPGSGPVVIDATVGIGEIFVLVPFDANVDVTGTVQGGRIRLFGRDHVGTALADHMATTGPQGGRVVTLRLEAGIGQVRVERATVGGY